MDRYESKIVQIGSHNYAVSAGRDVILSNGDSLTLREARFEDIQTTWRSQHSSVPNLIKRSLHSYEPDWVKPVRIEQLFEEFLKPERWLTQVAETIQRLAQASEKLTYPVAKPHIEAMIKDLREAANYLADLEFVSQKIMDCLKGFKISFDVLHAVHGGGTGFPSGKVKAFQDEFINLKRLADQHELDRLFLVAGTNGAGKSLLTMRLLSTPRNGLFPLYLSNNQIRLHGLEEAIRRKVNELSGLNLQSLEGMFALIDTLLKQAKVLVVIEDLEEVFLGSSSFGLELEETIRLFCSKSNFYWFLTADRNFLYRFVPLNKLLKRLSGTSKWLNHARSLVDTDVANIMEWINLDHFNEAENVCNHILKSASVSSRLFALTRAAKTPLLATLFASHQQDITEAEEVVRNPLSLYNKLFGQLSNSLDPDGNACVNAITQLLPHLRVTKYLRYGLIGEIASFSLKKSALQDQTAASSAIDSVIRTGLLANPKDLGFQDGFEELLLSNFLFWDFRVASWKAENRIDFLNKLLDLDWDKVEPNYGQMVLRVFEIVVMLEERAGTESFLHQLLDSNKMPFSVVCFGLLKLGTDMQRATIATILDSRGDMISTVSDEFSFLTFASNVDTSILSPSKRMSVLSSEFDRIKEHNLSVVYVYEATSILASATSLNELLSVMQHLLGCHEIGCQDELAEVTIDRIAALCAFDIRIMNGFVLDFSNENWKRKREKDNVPPTTDLERTADPFRITYVDYLLFSLAKRFSRFENLGHIFEAFKSQGWYGDRNYPRLERQLQREANLVISRRYRHSRDKVQLESLLENLLWGKSGFKDAERATYIIKNTVEHGASIPVESFLIPHLARIKKRFPEAHFVKNNISLFSSIRRKGFDDKVGTNRKKGRRDGK